MPALEWQRKESFWDCVIVVLIKTTHNRASILKFFFQNRGTSFDPHRGGTINLKLKPPHYMIQALINWKSIIQVYVA